MRWRRLAECDWSYLWLIVCFWNAGDSLVPASALLFGVLFGSVGVVCIPEIWEASFNEYVSIGVGNGEWKRMAEGHGRMNVTALSRLPRAVGSSVVCRSRQGLGVTEI